MYRAISADSHVDLVWLPSKLFVENCTTHLRDRMPYVIESDEGRKWVTNAGAKLGFENGVGSGGLPYKKGWSKHVDRMAEKGLFEDGKNGIKRCTDPVLRVQDQDLDGISGEVLYGILGASKRLQDDIAVIEVMRIYNEWLADFCEKFPQRFAGLASIPSGTPEAAIAEVRRVIRRGSLRGLDIAGGESSLPFFHPAWGEFWDLIDEAKLPVHFHTIGVVLREVEGLSVLGKEQVRAVAVAGGQFQRAAILLSDLILGGICESHPNVKFVLGEAGLGWIPYMLERMDWVWEDQCRKTLTLTQRPSDYWRRQCFASYQSELIGTKLLSDIGVGNVMWASDFPHADGVWPDSQEFIRSQLGHLDSQDRDRVIYRNAAELYGFPVESRSN